MSRIAENLLVQLVERQPDDVALVVLLDTSNGHEGKFPAPEIPKVIIRIGEARAVGEQVLEIDGILIERAAWDALVSVLEYFMAAMSDQFTPADWE